MKKLSFKGIIIGGVVDVVSTNIFSIPLLLYIAATSNFTGMSEVELQAAFMDVLTSDAMLYSIQILIGCLCSILGGYIGARLAKHDELLNASLTSFLCVGGSVYALITGVSDMAVWQQVMFIFVSPVLAMFGGYLRLRGQVKQGMQQV